MNATLKSKSLLTRVVRNFERHQRGGCLCVWVCALTGWANKWKGKWKRRLYWIYLLTLRNFASVLFAVGLIINEVCSKVIYTKSTSFAFGVNANLTNIISCQLIFLHLMSITFPLGFAIANCKLSFIFNFGRNGNIETLSLNHNLNLKECCYNRLSLTFLAFYTRIPYQGVYFV